VHNFVLSSLLLAPVRLGCVGAALAHLVIPSVLQS
jgi:hypothetical protein